MSDDPILAALARIEAGLGALRNDMATRADLTDLRVNAMARLDRLQARIDQMQQEWFVAYAQGEGDAT
jgi:hypothetical protein